MFKCFLTVYSSVGGAVGNINNKLYSLDPASHPITQCFEGEDVLLAFMTPMGEQ